MPQVARWNNQIIATTEEYETVDGNTYFPPSSLIMEHFLPSEHTSVCGWKGKASYYDIVVDGEVNQNAAWFYPQETAKPAAENIVGFVAFWRGVKVTEE
eukprot:TRINITY_DN1500_c0_g1_i2.p1 TRINITY_DN1500_c0_g1~~TRINITY_DN1500_c0_g1_i2.p1  ORF type:complete len:112 (+),score=27.24 TRINITY_DN1500_c0_g1_i2:40-336(+)